MTKTPTDAPDLVADIGGANARFALVTSHGHIEAERIPSGADYPDLVREARPIW